MKKKISNISARIYETKKVSGVKQSPKPRILIVSTELPPETAGAEKIAWESAHLLADEYEVHILTTTQNPQKSKKIKIHTIPKTPLLTFYYSTIGKKKIDRLLNKYKFKIIHLHMSLPWGFVFRNAHAKKIITMHGCEYLHNKFVYRTFAKLGYKKADIIVSPSNWLKKYVKKNYGYDSIIIRNGIDTSRFHSMKQLQKKKVVLFVGRMIKMKGVLEIIRLAKEMPDVNFMFVGKGPLKTRLTLPNTKYLGVLPHEKLAKIYNMATVCVFPSYKENFPTVGIEAISCGCAVVATKLGFQEIIDNGTSGILVNQGNYPELKIAVSKLLTDEKFRKKIEKNALVKSKEFDSKKLIEEYKKIYERIN